MTRRRAIAGGAALAGVVALLNAGVASAATVSAPSSATAGQVISVTGTGFTPGDTVTCFVFEVKPPTSSTVPGEEVKTAIGYVAVGPGGNFTMTVRMPYSIGYEVGKRTIFCEDRHSHLDSAPVRFDTDYTVTSYTAFSGDQDANALGVNFFGQMPFTSKDSSPPADHGGVISGGAKIPIGLGGALGNHVFPTFLNDNGLATGYENPSPGNFNGFVCKLLTGCEPVDPGGLGGNTFIDAINDSSQLVASSILSGVGTQRAMACTTGTNLHCQTGPFNMGTLGGDFSSGGDVNSDDLLVGQAATSGGQFHAFSCLRMVGSCQGGMQDLGTLAGGTSSQATSVNDVGDIAGTAANASSQSRAFLKLPGQPMKSLGTPPGSTQSFGYGLNDQAEIVGNPPFIWSDNAMFDLESLLPSGWHLNSVNDINDFGQIAAQGFRAGNDLALRLDPKGLVGSSVIRDSGFGPGTLTVQQGGVVQFVNRGPHTHNITDASGGHFFASPTLNLNRGYSFAFLNAGTFPIRDTLHNLTATVKVPMFSAPASGGTTTPFQISWSQYKPPAHDVYDVQVKKPGAASFLNFRHGVTSGLALFEPNAGTGNYQFEARIRNTSNGHTSDWSPPLTVPVM
jgi:probable HAF family extracellular repeat protein